MKKRDYLKMMIEGSVVDFFTDIFNSGKLYEIWNEKKTLTVEDYKDWLHQNPLEGEELEAYISLGDDEILDLMRLNAEGLLQYKLNYFYEYVATLPYNVLKNLLKYEKYESLAEIGASDEFNQGCPIGVMEYIYLNNWIGTDYVYEALWQAIDWYLDPNK